jgi:hypothetical protein
VMYRSFSVWRRSKEGVYRYRMFENLETGQFSVQSRDFFGESSVPQKWILDLEQLFLELLIEDAPEQRCGGGADSIKTAINQYDSDGEDD